MIYVARRYRQKKNAKRNSAASHDDEMAQAPGASSGLFAPAVHARAASPVGTWSSAASSHNNRSVREQGISAPVMSENSLGWN